MKSETKTKDGNSDGDDHSLKEGRELTRNQRLINKSEIRDKIS